MIAKLRGERLIGFKLLKRSYGQVFKKTCIKPGILRIIEAS